MTSPSGFNDEGAEDQDKNIGAAGEKEEVFMDMSVDDGEEEDDQRQYPYATIAKIGVSANPSVLKKGGWLQPGDKDPRRNSAGRSPFLRTRNPFHTLIHNHQLENTPLGELPSGWNIDRTYARSGSLGPDIEDSWRSSSDDWNSPIGLLRSRIESNTEMIRNLGFQLEELKETIERLIRIINPTPPY